MCNIAGYVGSRHAAPLLLDMLEAEEGLAGGYYTGIATIHEGQLHYRKVIGDTARLRELTDAASLPGTIGIAHSRSKSGGDVEWGQPFIACDGSGGVGHETLAYLANGGLGYYKDLNDHSAVARELAEAGHVFRAVSDEPIGQYPILPDGRGVHVSDVMAHAIDHELAATGDPEEAIRRAFIRMPAEIVGLYITSDFPSAIYGAHFNQPCVVARSNDGTYIASSPMAFPNDPSWQCWVPPCSVFSVTADTLQMTPLGVPDDAWPRDIKEAQVWQVVLEALAQGTPMGVGALLHAMKTLSPQVNRRVDYEPLYQVLADLEQAGLVTYEVARMDGVEEGLTAPQFRFKLLK